MAAMSGDNALSESANWRSPRQRPDRHRWVESQARSLAAAARSGGRLRVGLRASSVAQVGQSLAAILPDDRGVALFDPLLPGAPPRFLIPPDRAVLGVFGDPAGRRLVTIEQFTDDPPGLDRRVWHGRTALAAPNSWSTSGTPNTSTSVRSNCNGRRPGPPGVPPFPLVAISPDGKTVAVAANRTKYVRLFSAVDGKAIMRYDGEATATGGRPEAEMAGRTIDTQTSFRRWRLGPTTRWRRPARRRAAS